MIDYSKDEIVGSHPLPTHLAFAIPLLIAELERCGGPTEYQVSEARRRSVVNADYMQFGGAPGEAAELVTQLAEAIAILSFAPGGIEIFGLKFVGKVE